jgi:hypothetical protein
MMPAYNEAVWRNGGSSPQKVKCEFGSLSPAGSVVEAATTPSRWDVVRHAARALWKMCTVPKGKYITIMRCITITNCKTIKNSTQKSNLKFYFHAKIN